MRRADKEGHRNGAASRAVVLQGAPEAAGLRLSPPRRSLESWWPRHRGSILQLRHRLQVEHFCNLKPHRHLRVDFYYT
uniref:Uncharacterized protein n=1 Tax=Setaria viridis TaxID=4556 RepID=A0A4U6TP08_SETVI|nr:hypothetical protein SEVIR_7G042405v2 [Setaria viridis]